MFHIAQGAGLGLLAVAVAYSRIFLGYHDVSQVCADLAQCWGYATPFTSSRNAHMRVSCSPGENFKQVLP